MTGSHSSTNHSRGNGADYERIPSQHAAANGRSMPRQLPPYAPRPQSPHPASPAPDVDIGVENTVAIAAVEAPRQAPTGGGDRRSHAQPTTSPAQFGGVTGAVRPSWLLVLITTVLGAVFLGVAIALQPVLYTSEALIEVSSVDSTAVLTGRSIDTSNDRARILNTEASVFLSDPVVDPAAAAVKRDRPWIRDHVKVVTTKDSDVLTIDARGTSAVEAQQIASQLSTSYQKYSQDRGAQDLQAQAAALQGPIDALKASLANLPTAAVDQRAAVGDQLGKLTQQQEQIFAAARVFKGHARLLAGATLPAGPSTLTLPKAVAVGAAIGLLIGVAFTIARRAIARW